MTRDRCIVIPAIKKNAVIPDQLVKKLAGVTLMERALNTARACVTGQDIITLTDSEEISLICERANTRYVLNNGLRFKSWDLLSEMREFLTPLADEYRHCIILLASSPLITWVDVEDAWKHFRQSAADCLITVKNVRQRIWRREGESLQTFLATAAGKSDGCENYVVETRALFILSLGCLHKGGKLNILPYFLNDRALEISNYQDWWICEKLLERRHVVFVVAGCPAIGLGHVYRALMLAHEITSHKITFVCTNESGLAAENVAKRDYHVLRQGNEPLWETVLNQRPDLVINDILNTSADYVAAIKASGSRCVNFEDEGPGSSIADLVINALYEPPVNSGRLRCGSGYFCLRDEFLHARRNPLRNQVYNLLLTFGGTDERNSTKRILGIVEPVCRAFGIGIRIVAGPGYAHVEELEKILASLENPLVTFSCATNIMSKMMEGADLAICSAGRTVYELAWMRVPAIVLATHEREAKHTFARPRNGFAFAGTASSVGDLRIRNMFLAMLKQQRRARYWERQNKLDFSGNKERVVGLLQDQLELSRPDFPYLTKGKQ